jgi:hypothetical protein
LFGIILYKNKQPTFIDKDYVEGDVKWDANDMEALAEFAAPTLVTAQHLLGYKFWLAQ